MEIVVYFLCFQADVFLCYFCSVCFSSTQALCLLQQPLASFAATCKCASEKILHAAEAVNDGDPLMGWSCLKLAEKEAVHR